MSDLTQAKLFADAMQITRKQGSYDDTDGVIVDTSSPVWVSCLGIALNELTSDMAPLKGTATGSTSSVSVAGNNWQYINYPTDFMLVRTLIFGTEPLSQISFEDLISGVECGYALYDDKILISSSSSSSYSISYYKTWPYSGGTPSTNLSILDNGYYTALLWKTVEQIYSFYEDLEGVGTAKNMYNMARNTTPSPAIIHIRNRNSNVPR